MVNFGPSLRTYTSQREVVYARRGMVCTTQPLASQAGLAMLKKGGNAIDAAIAAAACMTVLEPTSNGIGGDAFALVWCQNHLYGLNSSGFAPQAITAEAVRSRYGHTMPTRGFVPVTVPGIPAAWASLSERFGTLPFEELLEPAIAYAEEGYPLAATTASLWKEASNTFAPYSDDPAFAPWFKTFLPNGKAPDAGDIIVLPDHAKTLRTLAQSHCYDFYSGDLADRIDAFAHAHSGFLRKGDLEHFSPEWVSPISTNYRGYTVHEIPPNGQGLIALMALNILENFEPTADMADTVHHQIEAMKLAFSDGTAYIADPKAMPISTETLLSKAYSCERYAQIHAKAQVFGPGNPYSGGPSIWPLPTAWATWFLSSKAITKALAPASSSPTPVSPCRIAVPTFHSIRSLRTAYRPEKSPITPSFPASSPATTTLSVPSASWAPSCNPRVTCKSSAIRLTAR